MIFHSSRHLKFLDHTVCKNTQHVQDYLKEVIKYDGEGVMLRDPNSSYQRSRSSSLLKVKVFSDADGEVVSHEAGKGRLKGLCGALVIRMECGKEFKVGTG